MKNLNSFRCVVATLSIWVFLCLIVVAGFILGMYALAKIQGGDIEHLKKLLEFVGQSIVVVSSIFVMIHLIPRGDGKNHKQQDHPTKYPTF
jgi:uncharacterized BrkB/YihY/UPF0761 family membrane protein